MPGKLQSRTGKFSEPVEGMDQESIQSTERLRKRPDRATKGSVLDTLRFKFFDRGYWQWQDIPLGIFSVHIPEFYNTRQIGQQCLAVLVLPVDSIDYDPLILIQRLHGHGEVGLAEFRSFEDAHKTNHLVWQACIANPGVVQILDD